MNIVGRDGDSKVEDQSMVAQKSHFIPFVGGMVLLEDIEGARGFVDIVYSDHQSLARCSNIKPIDYERGQETRRILEGIWRMG